MNLGAIELSILLPAFGAGLLVTATHVPLGMQVLARGIVFIDLAIAQIAGCGVLLADQLGFEAEGVAVQVAALVAALARRAAADLDRADLARRAGGGDRRRVRARRRPAACCCSRATCTAASTCGTCWSGRSCGCSRAARLGGARLRGGPRALVRLGASGSGARGFYVLFAVAVTVSVQLVGLYLVFATLIVPPLATRRMARAASRLLGARRAGYALGLSLRRRSTCRAGR